MVPRYIAARRDQVLEEDIDLMLAQMFHVDPHTINEVWPTSLRDRALAYVRAQDKAAERKKLLGGKHAK